MILYITLLILSFLLFKFVWRPWQKKKWYADNFRKKGYRVLDVPFRPFGAPLLDYYNFSNEGDDALGLIKERYPHHDVVLFNILHLNSIEFVHPDLVQEFFSVEKSKLFTKTEEELSNARRGLGNGLILSEGNAWKMKRKVLQEVFHFDFIKSLAPKIESTCEKVLNKMENNSCQNVVEYDIHDFAIEFAGNAVMICFFGQDLKEEKIENLSIFCFMRSLMKDLVEQTVDPFYGIFGVRFGLFF